jgi:cation transport ATPase
MHVMTKRSETRNTTAVLHTKAQGPLGADDTLDTAAQEEQRRRHAYAESILRAASENEALIKMARESARLAEARGTDTWPTLEEVERALDHHG